MNDDVWRRDEVDSPCVQVCVVHPGTGFCLGCRRTLSEIARWSAMSTAERQAVLAELPGREAAPGRRRGGAAARRRSRTRRQDEAQ